MARLQAHAQALQQMIADLVKVRHLTNVLDTQVSLATELFYLADDEYVCVLSVRVKGICREGAQAKQKIERIRQR